MGINPFRRPTSLPPHPLPVLGWTINQGRRLAPHNGEADGFTFIFPVVKWLPPAFQPGPGPIYNPTKATAIGHQPFNATAAFPSTTAPMVTPLYVLPQSRSMGDAAPLILKSQQTLAMILQGRSQGG